MAAEAPPAAKAAPADEKPKPKCFWDFVLDHMKAGLPKAKAMRLVAIDHPAAHAAYLRDHNDQARDRQQARPRKGRPCPRALAAR